MPGIVSTTSWEHLLKNSSFKYTRLIQFLLHSSFPPHFSSAPHSPASFPDPCSSMSSSSSSFYISRFLRDRSCIIKNDRWCSWDQRQSAVRDTLHARVSVCVCVFVWVRCNYDSLHERFTSRHWAKVVQLQTLIQFPQLWITLWPRCKAHVECVIVLRSLIWCCSCADHLNLWRVCRWNEGVAVTLCTVLSHSYI